MNRLGTAFGFTAPFSLIAALATAGCGSPPPAPAPAAATPTAATTTAATTTPAKTTPALPILPAPAASAPAAPSAAPTAKGEPAPAEAPTIAHEVAALKQKYDDAQKSFNEKYSAAKTDDERSKIVEADYPRAETYAPEFLELAKRAKGQPAALDCYLWILQRTQDPALHDPIYATLISDHLASPKLVDVVIGLGRYSPSIAAEAFLRTLIEKSPHREVTGLATYALSGELLGMARLCETINGPTWTLEVAKQSERYYGKATLDELATRDPAELQKEAEDLLEDVAKHYKDVKSYAPLGVLAEGDLFELRNLKIGQVAPDIVGADVDNVAFKLSDYRGKVVVLDFWGFW